MKNIFRKIKHILIRPQAVLFLFLLLTMCITIKDVNQPTSATVGERIDVIVNVDVAPAEDASYNVVFGVLAPLSWDIASSATVSYTSPNGSGTMRLANSSDPDYAKQITDLAGIGANYGLVKWVVFISNDLISGSNGVNFSGQINLSMNVGNENMKTQLGYLVGTSGWGITAGETSIKFTPCMEVTGGSNTVMDLCGPIPFPVTFKPAEYSFNDIIHISFDATKGTQTGLVDANQVYLCGTAIIDGQAVQVCDKSDITKMRKTGTNLWDISIWPKQFFNALPEQEITDISFNFTNEAGDIIVKNPDTDEDFQIVPNCTN